MMDLTAALPKKISEGGVLFLNSTLQRSSAVTAAHSVIGGKVRE